VTEVEFVVRGVLRSMGVGTWTLLDLDRSSSARLGARDKVRVGGSVSGRKFETVAVPNGDGTHALLFTKIVQKATRTAPGDAVVARVRIFSGPRPIQLPMELRAALRARPSAEPRYRELAPSHRRARADFVGSGKLSETRQRRAKAAAERIESGVRDPRR
jgi:hypothetical protein